jgi:Fe-S-cluster-containing hydrogenase component 2
MAELKHGFRINAEKCTGRMNCMRACPTHAIRVKDGKARLIPELCIDCGSCLPACPSGAISATTITFAELGRFKFKVAVASPTLFIQFGMSDTPAQVARALLDLGFDAVWEYAIDNELIDRAITNCVQKWPGPFPLISSSCPVVVRLIQVAYPSMIDHLIPIEAPREIAGMELKRRYSRELGLKPSEIAAIYITPCQAKTISILQPAEQVESNLDGAVGISQVYNEILYRLRKGISNAGTQKSSFGSGELLIWSNPEGEFPNLSREHYLALTGLPNVIKVFDDIEKGKLKNIEFLECHACQGGCVGGNLTVENIYAARAKYLHLMACKPNPSAEFEREVARRYESENFYLRAPMKPRPIEGNAMDIRQRVLRHKRAEELLRALPLLDCGLCGAPSCKNHAEDAAWGRAELGDCVFLSRDRIAFLRKIYKKGDSSTEC